KELQSPMQILRRDPFHIARQGAERGGQLESRLTNRRRGRDGDKSADTHCEYALAKSKSTGASCATLGELLKTQHLPIGYHAIFNIVTGNLLHPFQSETLDVEACDQDAVRHRGFESDGIEVI